jgi:signal transduction histidine kinase
VHDTGVGFGHDQAIDEGPRERCGMGLEIMKHRANMIGGSLEVSSHPEGTTVTCHFPIPPEKLRPPGN